MARIRFLERQIVPAGAGPEQVFEAGKVYDLPDASARFWKFKDVAIDAPPEVRPEARDSEAAAEAVPLFVNEPNFGVGVETVVPLPRRVRFRGA